MVVILAAEKRRSKDPKLNLVLRRIAAHVLVTGVNIKV